jgi:hypothetical protein
VAKKKDFLTDLIEDSTAEDSLFPVLHRAELERRGLMRQLAAKRGAIRGARLAVA